MTTDELIKNALELCGTRYEVEAGLKHRLLSELAHALARAEAERDAQHDLVLRLTAERDAVSVVHACPPKGSGVMPCCWATPFEKQGERLTADPALVTSAERHYLLYLRVNAPRLAPSVRNQPPRHTDEKPHHPPQKQREPVRSSL